MSTKPSPDVLVIGGGIVGCSAAYFLSKLGARVTLVERDGVAAHASGLSAGGLNPLAGDHIPGPLAELAMWSYRMHLSLWEELAERSDVAFEPRLVPWLRVALSEGDLPVLDRAQAAFEAADGFTARLLTGAEVLEMEPRITPDAIGGVYLYGNAAVDSRALTLALMTAAEGMGATFMRAEVRAIQTGEAGSVTATVTGRTLSGGSAVIAAGPWSTGVIGSKAPLPVRPLKGQILRLDPAGPAYRYDIAYPGGEAHPKPDGLVWVGATVEDIGFDARTTDAARSSLMADAVRAIPALAGSRLAEQTACHRPVTADGLPAIGRVPGHENVYAATGAGKKGILLGPAMGKAVADMAVTGQTDVPVDGFGLDRFA